LLPFFYSTQCFANQRTNKNGWEKEKLLNLYLFLWLGFVSDTGADCNALVRARDRPIFHFSFFTFHFLFSSFNIFSELAAFQFRRLSVGRALKCLHFFVCHFKSILCPLLEPFGSFFLLHSAPYIYMQMHVCIGTV